MVGKPNDKALPTRLIKITFCLYIKYITWKISLSVSLAKSPKRICLLPSVSSFQCRVNSAASQHEAKSPRNRTVCWQEKKGLEQQPPHLLCNSLEMQSGAEIRHQAPTLRIDRCRDCVKPGGFPTALGLNDLDSLFQPEQFDDPMTPRRAPVRTHGHKLPPKGFSSLKHTRGGTRLESKGRSVPRCSEPERLLHRTEPETTLHKPWGTARAPKKLNRGCVASDNAVTLLAPQNLCCCSFPRALRQPVTSFSFQNVTVCILRRLKNNFPFRSAFYTASHPFQIA